MAAPATASSEVDVVLCCAATPGDAVARLVHALAAAGLEAETLVGLERDKTALERAATRHGPRTSYVFCRDERLDAAKIQALRGLLIAARVPAGSMTTIGVDWSRPDRSSATIREALARRVDRAANVSPGPVAGPPARAVADRTLLSSPLPPLRPPTVVVDALRASEPETTSEPLTDDVVVPSAMIDRLWASARPRIERATRAFRQTSEQASRTFHEAWSSFQALPQRTQRATGAGGAAVLLVAITVIAWPAGEAPTPSTPESAAPAATPTAAEPVAATPQPPPSAPVPAPVQPVEPTVVVDAEPEAPTGPARDFEARLAGGVRSRKVRVLDDILLVRGPRRRLGWQVAHDYCRAVVVGGVTGFRLPTIGELASLRDNKLVTRKVYWSATEADAFAQRRLVLSVPKRRISAMPLRSRSVDAVCVSRTAEATTTDKRDFPPVRRRRR